MLIKELCVVSYDHHFDSLWKQKCKDQHWNTHLSTRGQALSLWETSSSAVHHPSVPFLLLTRGSWWAMSLSLPLGEPPTSDPEPESLLHSHSPDLPNSAHPDSHGKQNLDPPAPWSSLNNWATSALQYIQHSQGDRQKPVFSLCL